MGEEECRAEGANSRRKSKRVLLHEALLRSALTTDLSVQTYVQLMEAITAISEQPMLQEMV